MCIRKWLRGRRDLFIENEKRSPKTINGIYYFFYLFHRLGQFFCFWFGGRFVYFLLFILSGLLLAELYYIQFLLSLDFPISSTTPGSHGWESLVSWSGFGQVVLIYMIVVILIWIWSYQSTLVIEEFTDDTCSDKDHKITGIDTLLIVKLGRISQLYRDVNEQRPISTLTGEFRQISAVLRVDSPMALLTNAESTTSKLSLGPIEIPVGLFISVFNNLGRGPRIRGSVRKEKDGYVLLATMSGRKFNYTWKINSREKRSDDSEFLTGGRGRKDEICGREANNISDNVPEECPIIDMVKDLAYQIYTDLPSTGSYKWQATCRFNSGLRSYRECLRTPKDQDENLKKAEHLFQKALVYDNTFANAWYNLGVVYSERNLRNAAEKAFLKSIEQDPNEPTAYYALAQTRYHWYFWKKGISTNEYESHVLNHCSQVCNLFLKLEYPFEKLRYRLHRWTFPDYYLLLAQNLNLTGLTYMQMALNATDVKEDDKRKLIEIAIKYHKKALALSWKNYSHFTPFGIDNDNCAKNEWEGGCRFLAECLSDLGWACVFRFHYANKKDDTKKDNKSLKFAGYLINKALMLNYKMNSDCTCPELHWRMGVVHLCNKNAGEACKSFERAIKINPETMKYPLSLLFASGYFSKKEDRIYEDCNLDALQYAVQSYENEREMRDDQWRSLQILLDLMKFDLICIPDCRKCVPELFLLCNLRRFVSIYYCINKDLDFYDEGCTSEYEKYLGLLRKQIEIMNPDTLSCDCAGKNGPKGCKLKNWMFGHYYATKGRLYNFRGIYNSGLKPDYELNPDHKLNSEYKCYQDLNLDVAEDNYKKAFRCFREFPKEREILFSKMSLVEMMKDSHDYSLALVNAVTGHELNPMGDYQHIIQGILSRDTKNYARSIDYINEALERAYNIPNHSHYINNQYYRKMAYSHFMLAGVCSDPRQKKKHFDKFLTNLDQSHKIFALGLKKELKADDKQGENEIDWSSDKLNKISKIYDSIMASNIWKGWVFSEKKEYSKAIYYYNIVFSYYNGDFTEKIKIASGNQLWPGKKYQGFDETLISLHLLGSVYYKLKNYSESLNCHEKIIGYKDLIQDYVITGCKGEDCEGTLFIGDKIWLITHPLEIFIKAYLAKVRICADMHVFCEKNNSRTETSAGIGECFDKARILINALIDIKESNIKKSNENVDLLLKELYSDFFKCKGLIALEFNMVIPKDKDIFSENEEKQDEENSGGNPIPEKENQTTLKTEKNSSNLKKVSIPKSIESAIRYFQKSIGYYPDPETYVFLLKAFEKKINLKKKPKDEEEKETCINEAKAYLDALKRVDAGKEHGEFIREYENKLEKFPIKEDDKDLARFVAEINEKYKVEINEKTKSEEDDK